MKYIAFDHRLDVPRDIVREAGIDLGENIATVKQRPHLANCLVTYPSDHAADVIHYRVYRAPLVLPILLLTRQTVENRVPLAVLRIGKDWGVGCLVLQVIDARTNVNDRPKRRVDSHVLDAVT